MGESCQGPTSRKMSDDAVITLVNPYWHNFVNGAGSHLRMADTSGVWDVIDIAFADNDRNADDTVRFNQYFGGHGCLALDPAALERDMTALQTRGAPTLNILDALD